MFTGTAEASAKAQQELFLNSGIAAAGMQSSTAIARRARTVFGPLVSGFGMVTYDRCLCTGAVILGRSS